MEPPELRLKIESCIFLEAMFSLSVPLVDFFWGKMKPKNTFATERHHSEAILLGYSCKMDT
jgi:hypothetical protein